LEPFSPTPQPYLTSLELENKIYRAYNLEIPLGFGGTYYFYAFFVPEGKKVSDILAILAKIEEGTLEAQSNIAVAKVTYSNE